MVDRCLAIFPESCGWPGPYQPTLSGEKRYGETKPKRSTEELLWLESTCCKERSDDRARYGKFPRSHRKLGPSTRLLRRQPDSLILKQQEIAFHSLFSCWSDVAVSVMPSLPSGAYRL